MKAARYHGRTDVRIEDIEHQPLREGTVRIDVAWCGLCGSDLHEYLEGPFACPPPERPNAVTGESMPVTLGHEFSGIISEVGAGVSDLEVGDHVVVEPYLLPDSVDTSDNNPTYHLTPGLNFLGFGGGGGGLQENVVVPRRWVHKVSEQVPLDEAALIEPASVAFHAVERAGITADNAAGKTALIGGAGPIGLLTAAVLKALGARVIVSEISDLRRAKALESGVADVALDPRKDDVVAEVRKLCAGRGADVGFECTSVQVVLDTLLDAVRPQGVITVLSIWVKPAALNLHKVVMRELEIRGTIGYVHTHPKVIALVESGKLDLRPFITAKIPLEALISEGFDTLIHHNESAVKILVSPSGRGVES